MGHSPSKLDNPVMPEDFTEKDIPQGLTIASKKTSLKGPTLELSGAGAGVKPTYFVRLLKGYYGSMVLHDGPIAEDMATLANVQPHGRWRQDFLITLPGLDGGEPHAEVLRYIGCLGKKERYWFAMEVGHGLQKRNERFEWRRSHGEEVKSLGEHSWGWKLVALGIEAAEQGSSNEKSTTQKQQKQGRANVVPEEVQSEKVVAVFADAKIRRLSLTHIGEFEFRNAGASGEFGVLWSIMTLLSCLCIWQKEVQTGITAASVS